MTVPESGAKSEAAALASFLGRNDRFERAIADFSVAYAGLNERDYQALLDARDSGRITVKEPEP
jgi:hypothetical protein